MVESRRKGFTLLEMLLVLMVIAILAVVVLPRVANARRRAKDEATRLTLKQLNAAVDEFESDVGCYPINLTNLVTRLSPLYVGRGIAGSNVAAVTIQGADLLWRGPYLRATIVPRVPIGGSATWQLVINNATLLGRVRIRGTAARATDGTRYNNW